MCSLVSGFLQGLVKICIKYIEANHFLLLNCSTRRQCIVFLSSLVALFGGICVSRGNYFRGKFYGEGGGSNFPGPNFLENNCPGEDFLEGNCAGSNCLRLIFLGGNYPRG